MSNCLKKATLFFFFLFPIILFAETTQKEKTQKAMFEQLDIIRSTFEVKYAPAEWKKKFAGWDLQKEINIAKTKVLSLKNPTVKDFRIILKDFFNSTKDYHVGIIFYSTESAFLPFRVQGAEGRYFVTWVDNEENLPFAIGDEIIEFGRIPTDQVVQEIKRRELGNPESLTDQGLAEFFLTIRIGALGHIVPKEEEVSIVVKHTNGRTAEYTLSWELTAEEIKDIPFRSAQTYAKKLNLPFPEKKKAWWEHAYLKRPMTAGFYDVLANTLQKKYGTRLDSDDESDSLLGNKMGPLPAFGRIVWKTPAKSEFRAYLFLTPDNRLVGYVRIPHFMGSSSEAEEFSDLISLFEEQSDALIIDQLNNPGGNLFYLYGIASMLSPSPLNVPSHRVTLTQEDIYFAHETLDELDDEYKSKDEVEAPPVEIFGYPVTPEFLSNFINSLRFMIQQWELGNHFTEPMHLFGIEKLTVNPKSVYTKPIIVLVNHLDFSCGDFFPAILQDNNRALIVGTKTAGAGGYVLGQTHPNLFGIAQFTYTGSIAKRENQEPIENLGIQPDIVYEVSVNDLQNGYKDYAAKIQEILSAVLEKNANR